MIIYKNKEYLAKREFANEIEVSYNTVTSMVERGIIEPALKVDKREFYTQEQVEAYWRGEYVPVPIRKSGDNNGNSKD